MPDTPSQNKAVKSIKDSMKSIQFTGQNFPSPIAYSFMYIQWEANEVSAKRIMAVDGYWKEFLSLCQNFQHIYDQFYFFTDHGRAIDSKLVFDICYSHYFNLYIRSKFSGMNTLKSLYIKVNALNARVIGPTSWMITHWIF